MMNKDKFMICIAMSILGVIMGAILANKQIKIEELRKENIELHQEIADYKWQIEQVPYIIESWCENE